MTTSASSAPLIMLNGTSSAGKTTLARAIQRIAETPWLYTGIDACFAMVPEKWGGGEGGPLSYEGFRYDQTDQDASGHPLVMIRYGATGKRILDAWHRSTAALLDAGLHVLVDEMLLSDDTLNDWLGVLHQRDTFLVKVDCRLDRLEERERGRRRRPGLARAHLRTVHQHDEYDFAVDTTEERPDLLAEQVLAAWEQRQRPSAVERLWRRRSGSDPVY